MNIAMRSNTAELLPSLGDVLAPLTDLMCFAAGAKVFEEDDAGDDAYLIESGFVEISRKVQGRREVLAMLGPGEIFGEMASIEGVARSATATAVHETVLVPVTRQQIEDALSSVDPLSALLIRTALGRLRKTQQRIVDKVGGPAGAPTDDAQGRLDAAKLAAAEHIKLNSEIRAALLQEQFELAFQPIYSMADGRVAGAEALIRWRHPGRGFVSPAHFIPAAEGCGLIVPIGEWVLKRALQAFSRIKDRPGARRAVAPFISVNVSPRQIETEDNVERLANIITQSDLDPARIKLEITEQALHDPALAMAALERLRQTGVGIAVDDFGTGYSSLNHLCRYPMDTLKVDQSFVSSIGADERGERVVGLILGMATALGMRAVAEGVETAEQYTWLQRHGCEFAQGYLMAKPVGFEQIPDAINAGFRFE